MSQYGDYVKERLGRNIIENDAGFIVYSLLENGILFIDEFYIATDKRSSKAALALGDSIFDMAELKLCLKVMGKIVPSANGSTQALKTFLHYGFKLIFSDKDAVFIEKDV